MVKKRKKSNAPIISRGELSAGAIVLHELARTGAATFRQLTHSALARTRGSHLSENSYYTALARLRKRKLIDKGGYGYALTPRGEWSAIKAYVAWASSKQHRIIRRWDGKWRIVLFDFPERKRVYRDYVRNVLKRHGFREFQRSTWIHPHKIPVHIERLFKDERIQKNVRVITGQDINYDKDLRRKFKLT